MRITFPKLLLAGVTALALSGLAAAADFFDGTLTLQGMKLDLGEAGRTTDYAVLTTKGSFNANGSFTGALGIGGNIGVNGGSINLNDGAIVNGNATLRTGGSFNVEPPSAITGMRFQKASFNTRLTNGVNAANTFAARAAALHATRNYSATPSFDSNLFLENTSLTIAATDSSPVVLKLTNFTLDAGTFTLVGTAMSKFIIDIDQSLNLANGSSILLSGGLLAGNVVFNVVHGSINLSDSQASGILLATKSSASLSNSTVTGEVIAKYVNLNDGSVVKKPAKPSP